MISILSSECWECKNLIHFSILLPGDTVPQYNTDTIISIFRYFGLTFQILMEFLETKYETLHHFDCLGNLSLVVGGGVDCCSGVLTGVSVYYWLICIYLLILCPLGTSGCDASTVFTGSSLTLGLGYITQPQPLYGRPHWRLHSALQQYW